MADHFEHTEEPGELYEHFRFVVDRGQVPVRIDKYMFSKLSDASRNRIRNAAKAGNILVNGQQAKPSHRIKPLDVISIVLAYPPRDTEIYPEAIPVDILYEDNDILVVDKAAGMVVHPGHGNFSGTLLNALLYHFLNTPENIAIDARPYLAHRIDKDTTGILLVAKNELAQSRLAKQFFDHTVDRTYMALVWGDMKQDKGTISGNISRDPRIRTIMSVSDDEEVGRRAVTHFTVAERFGYVTLIECRLETGRTHQIRVHFKHIGHPLFNDESYGGDKILKGTTFAGYSQFIRNCFAIMPRQALHARSLGFTHPSSGKRMDFDSGLPGDFREVLEKWRRYVS